MKKKYIAPETEMIEMEVSTMATTSNPDVKTTPLDPDKAEGRKSDGGFGWDEEDDF